jgi:hypothetical protein
MNEINITIDESGDLLFLDTDSCNAFKDLGAVTTKRASYVLPANFWKRQAFKLIRSFVKDDSASAGWCRTWGGSWLVDLSPIGGSILRGYDYAGDWIETWPTRQDAINAEMVAVDEFFLKGKK